MFSKLFAASCAVIAWSSASICAAAAPTTGQTHVPAARRISLPLAFEPNRGQAPSETRFLARSGQLSISLQPASWRISAGTSRTSMHLVGARRDAPLQPESRMEGRVSYFFGQDPTKWQRGLPTFGRIVAKDAYPGIDIAHYGNKGRFEHDFIVHPGGDPSRIAIHFDGVEKLSMLPSGDLEIATLQGVLQQMRPVAFQNSPRGRVSVASNYVVTGNTVRFQVGRYDHTRALVIDPVLNYSSYLGGVGYDVANAVAVDSSGAVYVTGQAGSDGFPFTLGSYQQTVSSPAGFLAKINPQGTGLVYCVNFGDGLGNGVAVDALGNAYVGGTCGGLNFPVTAGAFQTAQWGYEAFVLKVDPTGTNLVYSSRFGGAFDDFGNAIAIDGAGNAVLVGNTSYLAPGPGDFPTRNAFQPAYGGGYYDMFVTKLNASGTGLVFSTYLGGGAILNNSEDYGTGVAVDPNGNIYVGGMTYSPDFPVTPGAFDTSWNGLDGTVTKFTPLGAVVYSTFVGGIGHEEQYGIAVDALGSAFVTGLTNAQDFPTTAGAYQRTLRGGQDAYVAKLTPSGGGLSYGTYLGGVNVFERGWSIAVDGAGNAWVTGDINESGTTVYDFPVLNAVQPGAGGGLSDGFVAEFGPTGGLLFSSYLGGSLWDQGHGVAVDAAGSAYVVGSTSSDNFPVTAGAFQPANAGGLNSHDDAFVLKLGAGIPQAAALASYVISPTTVAGGSNAIGTISLTAAAPSTGASITLLTNSPVVNIPASIVIPAGQKSVSFTIGTQIPSTTTTATLGARYGGVTINATLTVTVKTASDVVAIQAAEYRLSKKTLKVQATSTGANAVLSAYVTSTQAPIGRLTSIGGGKYQGQFAWPTNPVNITVKSSLLGSATRSVTLK